MLAIVAVVDLAREAALRTEARDHGRALQHRVGRSAEVLLKRDVDGDGVDGMDTHGALAWFASGMSGPRSRSPATCERSSTLACAEQGYIPAPKRGDPCSFEREPSFSLGPAITVAAGC